MPVAERALEPFASITKVFLGASLCSQDILGSRWLEPEIIGCKYLLTKLMPIIICNRWRYLLPWDDFQICLLLYLPLIITGIFHMSQNLEQVVLAKNCISYYPIINAPNSKPVLPSAAQTTNSTGQKIYSCIVLTLVRDQKVFSQPSHHCNFLYQGLYLPRPKLPAALVWKFARI